MVRIGMAGGASHIVKSERQHFVRAMRLAGSVATGTGNGGVCTCQRKPRLAMLCNRVKSAMEVDDGMARFAVIVVWRCRELVVMDVFVAIGAVGKLDFVLRVLPCRRMAFSALYGDVLAL